MKLHRALLLSGCVLLLVAGLAGCSDRQADDGAETGSTTRSRAAAGKDGPDGAVVRLAHGLADGRPEVAWQTLPPSYRKDVNELVNLAATKMDTEVWNRSFGLVQKLTRLAREKQDYFLDQPMLSQNGAADKKEMKAAWNAVAGILETLSSSELADLEKLEKLDIEEFLAGTGGKVMQQMAAAAALAPQDSWKEQMSNLRRTQANVVSEDGDSAVVRVEQPGKPPTEETYVKVEGYWVPKKLADGWNQEISQARGKIEAMSTESMAENKQSILMQIAMAESALDQLLATENRQQFDAALAPIMGMAMGAMMAQASGSGGMEVSPGNAAPFPNPTAGSISGSPTGAATPSFDQAQVQPPTPRYDRETEGLDDGKHEIYRAGEVRFDQAHLFVGQFLRVNTEQGLNAICRLKEARPGVLTFERALHGGSATFEVFVDEVESLHVVE